MTTSPTPVGRAVPPRWRPRALAVVLAAAGATVIWVIAVLLFHHELWVTDPSGRPPLRISLPLVIVFALLAGLIGWGALALLERLTRRARTIWTVLAVIAFLLSFAPLTGPGTPMSTRLILASMHVGVAAILIPALRRTGSGVHA